jgi:hypothetical protein
MTSRSSVTLARASLALIGTLGFSPVFAQDENPTTPGAIPNPSTYQGSIELQRQSDQQDQQFRQQQQQQPSYSGQPQQGGTRPSQSSGGQPASWDACFSHITEMRALAPIAAKIGLDTADITTRVDLFDDQTKPTAAEKILLVKWDEARGYCDSLAMQEDPARQTPQYHYAHSQWGHPAEHALVTKLLDGELTYGQFNHQRAMNKNAMRLYGKKLGYH